MATPARPDFDRRRSSSRSRDGQRSAPTSPVGSPPQLQRSILKRHPADQERRARADGPGAAEGGVAQLAAGVESSSAEALSAGETSGRETPASVATTASTAVDARTGFIRRVAFNTFDAGEELEGKAKATGGGTGAFGGAQRSSCSVFDPVPSPRRHSLLIYAVRQVCELLPESLEPDLPRRDGSERCVPVLLRPTSASADGGCASSHRVLGQRDQLAFHVLPRGQRRGRRAARHRAWQLCAQCLEGKHGRGEGRGRGRAGVSHEEERRT